MATYTLDFERPLLELERQIDELKRVAGETAADVTKELAPLEKRLAELRAEIYKNLTAMQRVQVARHPKRPYTLDYLSTVFTDFVELHGDRLFRDDPAIVGGWARLDGMSVMVIGHQKGRDTKENLHRNFGMAHPEGYRKALRLMHLADQFRAPVITLVDTPGASPGTLPPPFPCSSSHSTSTGAGPGWAAHRAATARVASGGGGAPGDQRSAMPIAPLAFSSSSA